MKKKKEIINKLFGYIPEGKIRERDNWISHGYLEVHPTRLGDGYLFTYSSPNAEEGFILYWTKEGNFGKLKAKAEYEIYYVSDLPSVYVSYPEVYIDEIPPYDLLQNLTVNDAFSLFKELWEVATKGQTPEILKF